MLSIYQVVNSGRVRLLILLLCWLPSWVCAQQVVVNMEGDYPDLKSNAQAFIGEVEGRSASNLRRYAPTAVGQAEEALRALGYTAR